MENKNSFAEKKESARVGGILVNSKYFVTIEWRKRYFGQEKNSKKILLVFGLNPIQDQFNKNIIIKVSSSVQ